MNKSTAKINAIIHNAPLALAINRSISDGLQFSLVHLGGKTIWDVFKGSLDAAIRDIENHPRGKLFQRLIEYGPPNPDDPQALTSDGATILSDPECGQCVQFIFYHMVNRFKGELAELLSIEPCIELIQQFQNAGKLPEKASLFMGNLIQERRRLPAAAGGEDAKWGGFTKGADGLIIGSEVSSDPDVGEELRILGVIEIKSMLVSISKMQRQINNHIARFKGGLKLGSKTFPSQCITLSDLQRIMIIPSSWKLSRDWKSIKTEHGREIVFPEPTEPPSPNQIEEIQLNQWVIRLAWSLEAIEQAAYEMTFWYMSQVGIAVYQNKQLPKGWEYMTPEEAGYNAIKMMLYYIPLRYITKRQARLAYKLYNAYSFGYPFAIDSKEMLWPEDFPDDE